MLEARYKSRSRRRKNTRWIAAAVILLSGVSCLAPVLYASTDCSRWIAEYRQGILQRRAARRLRAAKYHLTTLVHKPAPPHHHPMRHRMGPLESLRRFQIDCGDLDTPIPVTTAILPPVPVAPSIVPVEFPEQPPVLAPPALTEVAEVPDMPPLAGVPPVTVLSSPIPGPVPEPASLVLVLTGGAAAAEMVRRRSRLS